MKDSGYTLSKEINEHDFEQGGQIVGPVPDSKDSTGRMVNPIALHRNNAVAVKQFIADRVLQQLRHQVTVRWKWCLRHKCLCSNVQDGKGFSWRDACNTIHGYPGADLTCVLIDMDPDVVYKFADDEAPQVTEWLENIQRLKMALDEHLEEKRQTAAEQRTISESIRSGNSIRRKKGLNEFDNPRHIQIQE
jgi:hypothetical protein